jgi:uncharacterized protein (DUF302 family)
MKKLFSCVLLLGLWLGVQTAIALPEIKGVNTVLSKNAVVPTTNKLVKLLRADRDCVVRDVIDHQKIATALGHKMAPNMEVLFGCPNFDYSMVSANPMFSLYLPMTLVVWRDSNSKVYISYWNPQRDMASLLDLGQADAIKAAREMSERLARVSALAAAQ